MGYYEPFNPSNSPQIHPPPGTPNPTHWWMTEGLTNSQVANQDYLYQYWRSHVASTLVTVSESGGSAVEKVSFVLRKNLDHAPLYFQVRYKTDAGVTGVATVSVGGSDTTQTLATSTSEAWSTFSVTPGTTYTTGDPDYRREVSFKLHVSGGSGNVYVTFISCYVAPTGAPSAIAAGSFASGYTPSRSYGDAEAISTERLQRTLNNPIYLAKDRPACLLSAISWVAGSTPFGGYGEQKHLVFSGLLSTWDVSREFWYDLKVALRSTGTAGAELYVGNKQVLSTSSASTHHGSFYLGSGNSQQKGLPTVHPVQLYLTTTDSVPYVKYLQIHRKPA